MKKSLVMMCIGGMLALCTPLAASEASIDPPAKKEVVNVKIDPATEKAELPDPNDNPVPAAPNSENSTADAEHGGYIIISSAGLLLLIILLILLL